jgi:chromosome segregation ATPase
LIVDSQSSRILRLSRQNEDLTKVTQSQARQIEEFQTRIATAVDSKNKAEQELDIARKRLEDYDKHLESQDLTSQLLLEKVEALEAELQDCQPQIATLLQQRGELALERTNLHHSLSDVNLRVTELEHRLADREETVMLQEATLEELRKEVDEGRKELILVKQERDEMQKEAEAMSREALRSSMEVEVLRRRVYQLDEDILLRDGQICILRGGLEDS